MPSSERELQEWLRRTCREIEIVQDALAKHVWALDLMAAQMAQWEKQRRQELAEQTQTQRREDRKLQRAAARKGAPWTLSHAARTSNSSSDMTAAVNNVVIEHDRDGFMLVHVENSELAAQLQGRQRLRQLLLALGGKVSRVNMPTGRIIPFKTKSELIDAIEELSGQRISTGNLLNLVQQLRVLFVKALINPNLIETGGGGYRLRLHIDGRILENVK